MGVSQRRASKRQALASGGRPPSRSVFLDADLSMAVRESATSTSAVLPAFCLFLERVRCVTMRPPRRGPWSRSGDQRLEPRPRGLHGFDRRTTYDVGDRRLGR